MPARSACCRTPAFVVWKPTAHAVPSARVSTPVNTESLGKAAGEFSRPLRPVPAHCQRLIPRGLVKADRPPRAVDHGNTVQPVVQRALIRGRDRPTMPTRRTARSASGSRAAPPPRCPPPTTHQQTRTRHRTAHHPRPAAFARLNEPHVAAAARSPPVPATTGSARRPGKARPAVAAAPAAATPTTKLRRDTGAWPGPTCSPSRSSALSTAVPPKKAHDLQRPNIATVPRSGHKTAVIHRTARSASNRVLRRATVAHGPGSLARDEAGIGKLTQPRLPMTCCP